MSKLEFGKEVEYIRNIMVSVATGKQKIQDVDKQYKYTKGRVNLALKKMGLDDPNPYLSLWDWYEKWKKDFQTYQERRTYVGKMYEPIFQLITEQEEEALIELKVDLSDWKKIKNTISEIKIRENQATTTEQFQAVGMLCREVLITLAQTVFDAEHHPSLDGVKISETDTKRMLEAYIAVALAGKDNEDLRSYAKATNKWANVLTIREMQQKRKCYYVLPQL